MQTAMFGKYHVVLRKVLMRRKKGSENLVLLEAADFFKDRHLLFVNVIFFAEDHFQFVVYYLF